MSMNYDKLQADDEDLIVPIAHQLADSAHKGEYRRDGKTSYIFYLAKVVAILRKGGVTHPSYLAAAWLHDVAEIDTDCDTDYLNQVQQVMPECVFKAVMALTHTHNEPYMEYIKRCNQNVIAREVKLADIRANLSEDPTEHQLVKYSKALLYMLEGVDLS